MQALLLGLAGLVLGLAALQALKRAPVAQLTTYARRIGGVLALAGSLGLLVRGSLSLALPLAMLGLWLLAGQGLSLGGGTPTPGRTSKVATDHLEMELDLDTGAMHGRVLKGFFAGRRLGDMRPVELAHLWQDCRFVDPQSAQLIEAYLDRLHPTWREDMARAEEQAPKGPDGRMTRAEALEILGLQGEPGEDEIRRAHRDLMLKLHPDRGGSTYLAAKVNEAKEVLLAGASG
ncbi:MAG: molecular chaperone DnaJ [Hyphomicrobiaceae bacterium]|nr:molecular chaperone DnaJ [Hyphomicrobiaceae bacterium]